MCATETSDVPLTITLFGPMHVLVNGQPLPRVRSRKTLWLLALLTLRQGRPVEREWLAGTLWPDLERSRAFATLRPILSDLRDLLGSERGCLRTPNRLTVLLDLTGADVDVLAFDAAVKRKQLSSLEQAVELYRGPLLEGCLEEWVFQERTLRELSCLQALQTLAESAFSAGDYISAIRYYNRAVSLDPLADTPRRGLMETLSRSGDRNAALQVYREFVDVLRSDPRATPDEMTSDLYARLRAEAHVRVGARAEITVEKASEAALASYLPHPLTNLIGREDEMMEATFRLRRSRLVTLTGPGGIGKTRLALAVAADVVKDYPNGVWLVALEALTDGQGVLAQIASALRIKEAPGRPLKERVADHLRTRRLLLVLDNCEHLLEASARVVAYLLQECVEIRILATSREALGITGETVWTVPALAIPDLQHLPQRRTTLLRVMMSYESVQLFMERAQAVNKSFALTWENAMAVAQVCSRLEGIPLAIELAAARVKAMTVEQITVRLQDHLSLLTGGSRTATSRQQTLRATLDWSYVLLSQPERFLLARVSAFAGGWTLAAAEEVCSGAPIQASQVLDLLTSLTDKSLVVFEERGRYRLLETVRQYAGEHLQTSGEAEQVKSRQRYWYVALAEEAEAHLRGADQETWLHRLDTEHDNLQAALAWCGADTQGAEAGLRLAGALWRFWYLRGYYSEGRKLLAEVLKREEAQARTATRARALAGAGTLAREQDDYAVAQALQEEGLSIRRELTDRPGIANSLNNLGNLARSQGDNAAAQVFLKESLDIHRELGNRQGIANSLNNLGNLAHEHNDYAAARALYEESLNLRRELGDKSGIALGLGNLGNVATEQRDYAAARSLFEESLRLRREIGDRRTIVWTLIGLGKLVHALGEYAAAEALYEESLSLSREMGSPYNVAWALIGLGNVAYPQGKYAEARAFYEEGLSLCRELGDKLGIATALGNLGRTAHSLGECGEARALYAASLTLCEELNDRDEVARGLEGVAAVMLGDEVTIAVRLWGAAYALRQAIGTPLPLNERESYDRQVEQARSALGQTLFAAAWEEGTALTREQAVSYARGE